MSGYILAGYVVTYLTLGIYALRISRRLRGLQRELHDGGDR